MLHLSDFGILALPAILVPRNDNLNGIGSLYNANNLSEASGAVHSAMDTDEVPYLLSHIGFVVQCKFV